MQTTFHIDGIGNIRIDSDDIKSILGMPWRVSKHIPKIHCIIEDPYQIIYAHQMIAPYRKVLYKDGDRFNLTRGNLLDYYKLLSQKFSLQNSPAHGNRNAMNGVKRRERNGNIRVIVKKSKPYNRAFIVRRSVKEDGVLYTIETKVVIGGRTKRSFEDSKKIALEKRERLYSLSREQFIMEAKKTRSKVTAYDVLSTWSAYSNALTESAAMDMGLRISGGITPKRKKGAAFLSIGGHDDSGGRYA